MTAVIKDIAVNTPRLEVKQRPSLKDVNIGTRDAIWLVAYHMVAVKNTSPHTNGRRGSKSPNGHKNSSPAA